MSESHLDLIYLEQFRALEKKEDRNEKNKHLVDLIGQLQMKSKNKSLCDQYDIRLLRFYEFEWDHQFLVCTALRAVGNKRRHDWSKDYYYIFLIAGKFEFKVEENHHAQLWSNEVERHYFLEPHHPEYAKSGGGISILDIEEMAIDRLCRQAEKNNGEIDLEGMNKFLPNFIGKNKEQDLQLFQKYVLANVDLVKQIYNNSIKPNTSD